MVKETVMPTVPPKSFILRKLHAIMSEVDRIEKDAKNTHQNYMYASERVIKETLHTQLVKHKVLFYIETQNMREENGKTLLDVTYHFVDIETGQEINGVFVGSGQARDEKGNYAAVTGAIKYILTSTFLIPTGDDPEDDRNEKKSTPVQKNFKFDPPLPMTDNQAKLIRELTVSKGKSLDDLNGFTKKAYNVMFGELNTIQADKLIAYLEKLPDTDNENQDTEPTTKR